MIGDKKESMASLDMGGEGSDAEEASESPDEEQSEKDMHLADAFEAVQKGDQEGFVEAMKKCLLASDEGAYSGPDTEGEG